MYDFSAELLPFDGDDSPITFPSPEVYGHESEYPLNIDPDRPICERCSEYGIAVLAPYLYGPDDVVVCEEHKWAEIETCSCEAGGHQP